MSIEAAVVPAQTQANPGSPLRERETINQLVDAEKRLALALYSRLQIQLTPAERERVNRPTTRNGEALVEFGLGLEAHDAGRFVDASAHFDRAARLDGGFAVARQRAVETATQARAADFSASALADLADSRIPTDRLATLQAANPFQAIERLVPDPLARDAAAEAFGAEGFGRSGAVDITVQPPAGAGPSSGSRAAP